MLKKYFQIIRKALFENRVKNQGAYYEAHHIVPKSFGKQSSTVLLTPQEHYECHKLLAEVFIQHPVYAKKMLWAFHRLAYDKQRKLSAEEYAEAREALMSLWTRKKSDSHKSKISEAQKGNTNNKSRVHKGMKSDITQKGRESLSRIAKERQTGKIGNVASASKGSVVCEYENGQKLEAGSALQLSYITQIPQATVAYRLRYFENQYKKGYKIYYKS